MDADAGTVAVTRTATRAGGQKSTNAPKTAAGERTVTVPSVVADALRAHLAAQAVCG